MAIFGNVTVVVPVSDTATALYMVRPSNSGDVFLNYFFGIIFILYFLCGVSLGPLTLIFNFRQDRSLPNTLLKLVSLLDTLKMVYFPFVLVPKLLSSKDNMDMYYEFTNIGWIAHVNTVVLLVTGLEVFVVVWLCGVQYLGVKFPSLPKPLLTILSYIVFLFLFVMSSVPFFCFDYKPLFKRRIEQDVLAGDLHFVENIFKPALTCKLAVLVVFVILGVVFSVLIILHLVKNRECSERSSKLCVLQMNLWNIVVMVVLSAYLVTASERDDQNFSTGHDFFIFSATYGFPLTQSVVNTICFARTKAFQEDLLKRKVQPVEPEQPSTYSTSHA